MIKKAWGGCVYVVCIFLICLGPLTAGAKARGHAGESYVLKEAQLDKALLRLGQDFRLTIVFQSHDLSGRTSAPLRAKRNVRAILRDLLAPHPFDYKFINRDTVVIYRMPAKDAQAEVGPATFPPFQDSPESDLAVPGFLEEITISSRRWNRSFQSSPASVAIFTRDRLSSPDVGSLDKLSLYTSNVTLDYTSTLSGSSNSLVSYIRGIGQSDFAIATDPSIGLYLDGVYLSRSIGSVIDLAEYDRVEIYKGPHGNLFSRNTIGGTINITSPRPGRDWRTKVRLTTGSNQQRDVLLNMDVPLVRDRLYGNFLLSSRNRNGYGRQLPYEALTAADAASLAKYHTVTDASTALGDQNVDRFHGRVIWHAADTVEISVIADVTRSRERTPVSTLLGFSDNRTGPGAGTVGELYNHCLEARGTATTALCGGLYGVNNSPESPRRTPFDNRFITGNRYWNFANGPNHSDHDIYGLTGSLRWQANDNLLVKYIGGYRHTRADLGRDGDKAPILMDHTLYLYDHKQQSHEVQFSGAMGNSDIQWYGGLLYFRENARMNTHVIIGGLPLMDLRAQEQGKNVSWHYFAHANIPLAPALSLTAGFQFANEEKNLQLDFHETERYAVRRGVPLSQFPDPDDLTRIRPQGPRRMTLDRLSPRLSVEYDRDDLFAYFSLAKSTKAGGFNYRAVFPSTEISTFGPEQAWSYEAGVKMSLPDQQRVNLMMFHTNYDNLQLSSQDGVTPEIENAGHASLWGAELEILWRPAEGLNVTSSLGYIHARYTALLATSRIKPGYRFPKTPTWTFNLTADYAWSLSDNLSLMWRGSYSHKSEIWHNAENSALLHQPPMHLLDSSLTVHRGAGPWALTVGVNNILNEPYIVSGFNQPGVGFTEATFSRPRHWYLSLTFQM